MIEANRCLVSTTAKRRLGFRLFVLSLDWSEDNQKTLRMFFWTRKNISYTEPIADERSAAVLPQNLNRLKLIL